MTRDSIVLHITCDGEVVDPLTLSPGERVTIGRGTRSDLVLEDPHLSRTHLTLSFAESGELRACDLGSKNRSDVNGRAFRDTVLKSGDVISAGKCRFTVNGAASGESSSTVALIEDDDRGLPGTKFEIDSENLLEFISAESASTAGREQLETIFRLAEGVVGTSSRTKVLVQVEDALSVSLDFSRYFVGLGDPDQGTFEIRRVLGATDDDDQIQMSQSILNKVTREKKSVLVEDTGAELPEAKSADDLGISSFMCAPMLAHDEFIGLLYVDRLTPLPCFEESDLQFLQGVAHLVALALADLDLRERVERDNVRLREVIARKDGFVAKSPLMLDVLSRVQRYARNDAGVLILGETGTGKEHLARMLHDGSERCEGPFVAFNCALSSPAMIESELFGHVKGAFTGADNARKGRFMLAKGGTLFLDEIGDMPVELQAKLLRVLQESLVWPVGSDASVPTDVRLVSATHRNLKKLRSSGEFRDDLYYRLAALTIDVPRLAKRGDDVVSIAESMLGDSATLSPEAKEALKSYSWPGNVRELENAMEHAIHNRSGDEIRQSDLPLEIAREGRRRPLSVPVTSLRDMEAKQITLALESVGGNKRRAAELLGISRNTLYQKLQQYGI